MTAPTMAAPLPTCVTIDAYTPDGYLDNARTGTPGAGANTNTQMALTNLTTCLGLRPPSTLASIVGHGASGIIATGGGKTPVSTDQYISVTNEPTWTTYAALKGKVTDVYLYGCKVGASAAGAQLLFDMAKLTNATVWGPTGLIFCRPDGSFYLDVGAVWQSATAAARPAPIEPPVALGGAAMANAAQIYVLGNQVTVPIEQLASAVFTPSPLNSTRASLSSSGALDLAKAVLWDEPFSPQGEPSGIFSGRLDIVFGFGADAIEKTYLVYADEFLIDDAQPGIIYRVNAKFGAIIQGL